VAYEREGPAAARARVTGREALSDVARGILD
jgi:hypothetical protein